MNFTVARKAFIRIRDLKFIEFTDFVETQHKMKTLNEASLPADICAYLGKYKEAALMYQKCGASEKAVELFTSLKKFSEAMEIGKKGKGVQMSPEILLS